MQISPTTENNPISVLILIEDEAEAIVIIDSLNTAQEGEYFAYHASSIKKGRVLLKEKSVDLVLFDLNVPDSYGAHSFKELVEDFSTIPFIILTELNDDAIAQNSVLEGAQDFLLKSHIDSFILNKSINYAIQRKRTEKRLVAALIETEDTVRRRIASDLHDGLGQNLSSASINLQSLLGDIKDWSADKQKVFHQVLSSLQDSIAETRGIARNLMPKAVEEFGLVLSIESMINALNTPDIDFYFFDNLRGKRLQPNVEVMLYRIVQESVNNILKYAKAKVVTIHLMLYEETIILMIEDDGVGFKTNGPKSTSGVGLISIKNRVKSLSGNLIIDSSIGSGTTITIEIPNNKDHGKYNFS